MRLAAVLLCLWPLCAVAEVLRFPSNATLTGEDLSDPDSYAMPIGPWSADGVAVQPVEGAVTRQAWRIAATGLTTLQILRPLRAQLREAGFAIVFECQTEACGGFDFRFGTDVLSPPAMQVDLGDFRYLAARSEGAAGTTAISLLVSRTQAAGFVQAITVTPEGAAAPAASAGAPALRATGTDSPADLETALATAGRYVLEGLAFESGAARLAEGPQPSLQALADYLAAYPGRRVALVGHTDSSGSLEANIALSRRRAAAVLERLVSAHSVPRRQLEAQGMGYLAPLASNLTADGRALNRRVEVIVTSTD